MMQVTPYYRALLIKDDLLDSTPQKLVPNGQRAWTYEYV
jgi:hypothetical protein